MAKKAWERDLAQLNATMARISILATKAMSEADYASAVGYFEGMAHASSEKACLLRKLSRTHKDKMEAGLMATVARSLFASRAEWLKHASMIRDMDWRKNGSSKNDGM